MAAGETAMAGDGRSGYGGGRLMAILQSVRGTSDKSNKGEEGVSSWRCSPCFCPPVIPFSFYFNYSFSLVGNWWLPKLGKGGLS